MMRIDEVICLHLKKRFLLVAAMLMCLMLPALTLAEENLLVNGSFEQLDADGLPTGWYTDAYDRRVGVTLFSVTEDARTGDVAVVIDNLDVNDARFAQNVTVEPDSVYLLSGWIRADEIRDSGRGANLSVSDLYDACSLSVFESDGEWTYVQMYGLTGPEQTEVTVFVRMGGYSAVSVGRAAYDDLSLVKVDVLPGGAQLKEWYVSETEPPFVIAGDGYDDTSIEYEEPADAFWPWLLVISGVYILIGAWMQRWTQTDGNRDPALISAERRYQQLKGKGFPLSAEFIVLAAGLLIAALLRIVIAWIYEGYGVDVGCFSGWGNSILSGGPWRFYGLEGDFALKDQPGGNWCDYPPGYLYVLALGEGIHRLTGGFLPRYFVHKLVPMTCDLLISLLVCRMASRHGAKRWQATLMGLFIAFNPAVILNSAAWCQVDSVLCLMLLLVADQAIQRRWAAVLPLYVYSILIKPQALMIGPLGAIAIGMEMFRDPPRLVVQGMRSGKPVRRLQFSRTWKQLGMGLAISLGVALAVIVPFSIYQSSPLWLIDLYSETLASYDYVTINTTNLYYFLGANWQSNLYQADKGAVLALLSLSVAWGVYTAVKRKDRELSWREPLSAALVTLGAVFTVSAVLAFGSEEPFRITFGDPWQVYQTGDGYLRQFLSGRSGTWSMELSPWLMLALGVALLYAGGMMIWMIVRRIRSRRQARVYTGLMDSAVMGVFALLLAFLLVFDVTWGTLAGLIAMAMVFAVVLPMFLRGGSMKLLPLCGAVLFILLYVYGVKMHERYLFPALFLLGMAYVIHRDRRLLWLLIGLSCTLLINEGIILDNEFRLDSGHVHTDPDALWLTYLNALVTTMLGTWSAWLCHRICVQGCQPRLTADHREPIWPVRRVQSDPCTPLTFRDTSRVRFGKLDLILVGAVTLVYAIVTFATLGSTKAPQNPWKSTRAQEQVIIDLGEYYEDFSMLYFCQVSYSDFSVAVSDDDVDWPDSKVYWAEMTEGQCFRWKYVVPRERYADGSYMRDTYGNIMYRGASSFENVEKMSGRYVCITAQQVGLIINEVIFRDAEGNRIPATIRRTLNVNEDSPYYSDPANLLDEQDTLEGEPGWWNSTYFDEIYHARTGYEHATGQDAYEWTHPPLGKVIMSWFILLFGMTPFGWRFAGALCGVLMLPVMYLLGKQLTKRTDMGFAAMAMMALDCMHFTQTRIATIDSYPVLFIILSYFFMLRFMQRDVIRDNIRRLLPDLALCGFFMGCGVASKWIGIYAGLGLAVLFFWTCLRHLRIAVLASRMKKSGAPFNSEEMDVLNDRDLPSMKQIIFLCLWCLMFFVAVPLIIYILSYVVHYQARDYATPIDFLSEVWRTQVNMLDYHGKPGLGMDHPYYTPWYEWPTMQKPMYYASPAFVPEGWSYAIWCFGNPAVWLTGLVGMGYVLYRWVKNHRYYSLEERGVWHLHADTWNVAPAFVLIGFLAQLLPWVLVPRGTYIYHYFASVPFLILAIVLLLNRVCRPETETGRNIILAFLSVCLTMFLALFPFASGVLAPVEWMSFVRSYPWIDTRGSGILERLREVLLLFPLFPKV